MENVEGPCLYWFKLTDFITIVSDTRIKLPEEGKRSYKDLENPLQDFDDLAIHVRVEFKKKGPHSYYYNFYFKSEEDKNFYLLAGKIKPGNEIDHRFFVDYL